MSACRHCGAAPLPARHSRYCERCSPQASRLWKRAQRRSASLSSDSNDLPSWLLEGWRSLEARRKYFRTYMRNRRRQNRLQRDLEVNLQRDCKIVEFERGNEEFTNASRNVQYTPVVVFLIALFATNCSNQLHPSPATQIVASSQATATSTWIGNESRNEYGPPSSSSRCRPSAPFLEMAILIDNSLSMRHATSPRPSIEDFQPLLNLIGHCGGSIVGGSVVDRPTPFVRLYVPPPPQPVEKRSRAEVDLVSQAQLRDEDDASEREYEEQFAAWQRRAVPRIAAFRKQMKDMLEPRQWSRRTDLNSMLQMSDGFFLEPATVRDVARWQVLLIVSDCQDDVNPKPLRPLKSHPIVAAVNQIDAGDLENYKIVRFGDLPAALRFILSEWR
jgi:hypothetical protein